MSGVPDLTTSLGALKLPNPILVASGTFGYAKEARSFVDLSRLGGIVPKTITAKPRVGNPPPRIVETAAGMLNAIGLDNDGVDYFLENHLPFLRTIGVPIVVNVAGKSVEEFRDLAAQVGSQEGVAAVELNLSCPNVAGGTDYGTDCARAEAAVSAARKVCGLPILAKLTPNVTDVVSIAKAASAGGADGVTLINTVLGTAIDWRKRRPILAANFGGLSGPAIKPIALRCVAAVARATTIPICAVGGIRTIDDVMEFLVAGASAVQVGTTNFFDPPASMRLIDQLPAALTEAGAKSVDEVVRTLQWN